MATITSDRLHLSAHKQASWVAGAFRQFLANRDPMMAASIAFYSAFSLAPTLVMVIAVAGWVFGADAARGELFREVHNVLGDDAASAITTIVQNAHRAGHAGGIATAISLSMLIIGASATFSSLNTALDVVWPPEGSRASSVFALVRVRLVSFSLVLGVAFLLIVSLVLDTTITFIGQWLWGNTPYVIIGNLLQLAVGLVVLAVAFAALLRFLPDATVLWRDALVGGVVAAVLFSAGKKLFALYLAHAGMATTFGAAGSLAVLLMWLYFSAAVLLLGAEFSAARARMRDPRGAWAMTDDTPPGCRAKLASVLAASTHPATTETAAAHPAAPHGRIGSSAERRAQRSANERTAQGTPGAPGTSASAAMTPADARKKRGPLARLRMPLVRMEDQASYAAALTLVHAGRTAAAADRYVKRHPWRSVLLTAGAAVAMTAATRHRRPNEQGEKK